MVHILTVQVICTVYIPLLQPTLLYHPGPWLRDLPLHHLLHYLPFMGSFKNVPILQMVKLSPNWNKQPLRKDFLPFVLSDHI